MTLDFIEVLYAGLAEELWHEYQMSILEICEMSFIDGDKFFNVWTAKKEEIKYKNKYRPHDFYNIW